MKKKNEKKTNILKPELVNLEPTVKKWTKQAFNLRNALKLSVRWRKYWWVDNQSQLQS